MSEFVMDLKMTIDNLYCANKMLEKENKRLNNIINELGKYLEQRKEEWNNSRNKEDISSYHYIMLIKDLLEILKGSDNE